QWRERSPAELAQDQRRLAEASAREAARLALPFRLAFDEIGTGWKNAAIGLVEGTLDFRGAALEAARAVERGFVSMLESVVSKAAAGPLAGLLGGPTPAGGRGGGRGRAGAPPPRLHPRGPGGGRGRPPPPPPIRPRSPPTPRP